MRIILVLCLVQAMNAQVRIGQRAPQLVVGDVLQGQLNPAASSRAQLIEMWAPSCAPCVANIPHLNELADQFKNREIDFISLTGEDRASVESFLKTNPIRGVVALDPNWVMGNLYGGRGIPATVLIDRAQRIVRVSYPTQVTAPVLEDLIADRPVNLSAIKHGVSLVYPLLNHPADYYRSATGESKGVVRMEVGISDKTAYPMNTVRPGGGSITSISEPNQVQAASASLRDLLSFAYDLSPHQLQVSKYFQGGGYDLEGWVPDNHAELLKPLMRMALEAAIDYRPTMEKRALDVLVLKGLPGRLQFAKELVGCKSQYQCEGQSIEVFRSQVELSVGKLVVIDNPPGGRFSWKLTGEIDSAAAFEKALREQLGLTLKPERRRMDFLVIDSGETAAAHR
jgi:thiol-disulfide isomerase/thioredoxin